MFKSLFWESVSQSRRHVSFKVRACQIWPGCTDTSDRAGRSGPMTGRYETTRLFIPLCWCCHVHNNNLPQSQWRWPRRWGGSLLWCYLQVVSPRMNVNLSTSIPSNHPILHKRTAAFHSGNTVAVSILT